MIFSSKPAETSLPAVFNWAGMASTLFLILVAGFLWLGSSQSLSLMLAEDGLTFEKAKPSKLSFENFTVSPAVVIPPIVEDSRSEPLETIEPAPAFEPVSEQETDDVGESQTATDPSTLQKLARELNQTFNRVKYYSRSSQQAGLEGTALLLVTLDKSSRIVKVKSEHELPAELARDLAISVEKLEKSWRGRYQLESPLTIRLKVTYRLI